MPQTLQLSHGRVAVLPETKLFIDGEWVDAQSGETINLIDPATGNLVAKVAAAGSADVDAAVQAARSQFDGGEWSKVSGPDRARLLNKLAELVENDAANLAVLEALDVGKPLFEASLEVDMAAATFRYYAGWADRVQGSTFDLPDYMGSPRFSYTLRQPVGVVGAITPWNAPTMIASWKIAPALATGCTLVVKPSEEAPLTTLRIAELAAEAGFPAGVLNVINGTGLDAGGPLVMHPYVDKVSFTGSPGVGAEIARTAGPDFKRLTLELGGKSPQVIFPDADLDAAMPIASISVFANQGQTCAAGTRILVPSSLKDEVLSRLADQAARVKVGNQFDPETTMGSLISERQMERVLGYVDAGKAEGAELVTGGARIGEVGYFVQPTIFSGNNDLRIAREEIFGPVGTVIEYRDVDDALRLANETRYGLAAVVWTRDLRNAHLAAKTIRAGAVWVNAWGPPDPRLPWGGTKFSGIGQELGAAGIEACTHEKVVSMILPAG